MVPMETTLRLLRAAMQASGARKFLIDGFPRTLEQAEAFEATICPSKLVLVFDCPEDEMKRRLLHRGRTSGRVDDNEATIAKRLRAYVEATQPVVERYEAAGRARRVNAVPSAEVVFQDVRALFQPSIVLLVGATGSGRGSLATTLGRAFGYTRISTSELLRREAKVESPRGRLVARAMREGRTVPADVVLQLVRRAMRDAASERFLLDGFPRVVSDGFPLVHDQVQLLRETLGPAHFLIHLDADRVHRIERANNDADAVDAATEVFLREKLPVVRHYERLGLAYRISANLPKEEVAEQVRPIFDEFLARKGK